MRRSAGFPTVAWTRPQRYLTADDLNFNNVTWTKGGTFSTDVLLEGFRELELHAGADDGWALDVQVLNEDDTLAPTLSIFSNVHGGVGTSGGDPSWLAVYWPIPPSVVYRRIRFRGRGILASVTNGHLIVHARM